MTPKIRFNPSASKARRPANSTPLRSASRKNMSSWQSMLNRSPALASNARARFRTGAVAAPAGGSTGRQHGLDFGSAPWRSDPHVGGADLVACRQLRRGAVRLHPADLEQVGAINHLEHAAHVLLHDQHGIALVANAPYQVE